MSAVVRVWRAPSVRAALHEIPESFYERVALAVIVVWLVLPHALWHLEGLLSLDIVHLSTVNLQVGGVALVLAVLQLAGRRAGAELSPAQDPRADNLPLAIFGVFIVLAALGVLVGGATDATWTGDWYRRESIFSYASYVGFFYLASQVLVAAHRRLVLAVTLCSVVATCVVALAIVVFPDLRREVWPDVPDQVVAYFHQFNHYGYLLAVGAAIAAAGFHLARGRWLRVALLAALGLIGFTLNLNGTLGAFVALIAGYAVFVVWTGVTTRTWPRAALGPITVVGAVTIAAGILGRGLFADLLSLGGDVSSIAAGSEGAASAGTGRWGLWVTTTEQIRLQPWLGHGIEGIAELLPVGFGRPHNEYLQYAVFFGVPALLVYLAAIGIVFVRFQRRVGQLDPATVCAAVAAVTYLVSAVFGNTMYYTAPLLFMMLGLVWGGVRLSGESDTPPWWRAGRRATSGEPPAS